MRLIDADAIEYTHAVARNMFDGHNWNELVVTKDEIEDMPTIQPEPHEIGYDDCANALLKMWMDGVMTDWVYYRLADKLREKWSEKEVTNGN